MTSLGVGIARAVTAGAFGFLDVDLAAVLRVALEHAVRVRLELARDVPCADVGAEVDAQHDALDRVGRVERRRLAGREPVAFGQLTSADHRRASGVALGVRNSFLEVRTDLWCLMSEADREAAVMTKLLERDVTANDEGETRIKRTDLPIQTHPAVQEAYGPWWERMDPAAGPTVAPTGRRGNADGDEN